MKKQCTAQTCCTNNAFPWPLSSAPSSSVLVFPLVSSCSIYGKLSPRVPNSIFNSPCLPPSSSTPKVREGWVLYSAGRLVAGRGALLPLGSTGWPPALREPQGFLREPGPQRSSLGRVCGEQGLSFAELSVLIRNLFLIAAHTGVTTAHAYCPRDKVLLPFTWPETRRPLAQLSRAGPEAISSFHLKNYFQRS